MTSKRVIALALVMTGTALAVPACHATSPDHSRTRVTEGADLRSTNGVVLRIRAAPGDEWILQAAPLSIVSQRPITVRSVGLKATRGLGPVVVVKREWIAPLGRPSVPNWTPGGVFKSLPLSIH